MKNKIALVTEGMDEMGTAICRHLFTREAKVIAVYCHSNDYEAARTWQLEQRKHGYDIAIQYIDRQDLAACFESIKGIENEYGSIDILVNHPHTLENNECHVTHHVISGMSKRFYGRIINLSPINSHSTAYVRTHEFTKNLAHEVAHKGITVNTVLPGFIETCDVISAPDEFREKLTNHIPVGRLGKPEDIARAVGFFAAQANSFITGSYLTVNGGQYLL